MEIQQKDLKKIVEGILRVLEREDYLKEPSTQILVSKKQAYVLCEMNHEKEFIEFLRSQKSRKISEKIAFTAILETPDDALIDALVKEELCQQIAGKEAEQDPRAAFSIYPAISRNSLCAAGLGMDQTFTSMWIRKDFELGRKSVLLVGGIEPFTGLEPEYYKELIMSYIKNLMRMDVCFMKETEDLNTVLENIEKQV